MPPAVLRAKDATLIVGGEDVAQHGDVHKIRVCRVDADAPDLPGIAQPRMNPGATAIARTVHADAGRDVVARTCRAGANVNDIRIGIRNGDGADRAGLERSVRDVPPRHAGVGGLPDAASCGPEVIDERLRGHASDRRDAAAAAEIEWAIPHPAGRR